MAEAPFFPRTRKLFPGKFKSHISPGGTYCVLLWEQGKGSEKWPHMSDHSFTQQTFHLPSLC